ncbi:unnamed protein product [Salmonella enterica subsp. enterica serovar Typhimurium]|nr:unnamed protein product [Salmonella enterica subsp. enterica serovar Typhimurium]
MLIIKIFLGKKNYLYLKRYPPDILLPNQEALMVL